MMLGRYTGVCYKKQPRSCDISKKPFIQMNKLGQGMPAAGVSQTKEKLKVKRTEFWG